MPRNTRTVRCDRASNKSCRCILNNKPLIDHEAIGFFITKGDIAVIIKCGLIEIHCRPNKRNIVIPGACIQRLEGNTAIKRNISLWCRQRAISNR